MLIKNKTLRIIVVGKLKLIPGMNDVRSTIEKRELDGLNDQEKRGNVEIQKLEIENDLEEGISQFKAADVLNMISETHDEDQLKKYLEEETAGKKRKSVIEALENKIASVKDAVSADGKNE